MYITEVARMTAVTVKALRYFESIGLICPERSTNDYRHYDEADVRAVVELRELTARRDALQVRLDEKASFDLITSSEETTMTVFTSLASDLPVPENDGAADHLPGLRVPVLRLIASDGSILDLGSLAPDERWCTCTRCPVAPT